MKVTAFHWVKGINLTFQHLPILFWNVTFRLALMIAFLWESIVL